MEDLDYPPQSRATGTGGQTTALFLALYLLVLAFFIVLVTISSLEETKSKAVMDSLTTTFSAAMSPTTDATVFTAQDGNFLAGEAFLEEISEIFATTIQVAKVEMIVPGRSMRVIIPSESLFHSESIRIREAQIPFLDRIVAALSASASGLSHELEFMVGIPAALGEGFPVGTALEKSRAGAFARTMRARGAPRKSLFIGLRTKDPRKIVFRFSVRTLAEKRLEIVPVAGRSVSGGNGA